LAYCREKGIKAVDIRFPDSMGRWRHFAIPAASLNEAVFDTGFGTEACWSLTDTQERTPWILVPVSEAKYLDPFQHEPTLILLASIQDAWTGQEAWFDPRAVATRAVEAFRGAGVADEIMVSMTMPLRFTQPLRAGTVVQAEQDSKLSMESLSGSQLMLAGGRLDPDSLIRSGLMHKSLEAGLSVERHYRGVQSSSEFLLGAKPLVQACDDHLLLGALIESTAMQEGFGVNQSGLNSKASWSFIKGSEPILGGPRGFGLSDLGWYAAGGILKHADALNAIAASCEFVEELPSAAWKPFLSDRFLDCLVGVGPVSNDPRYRSLIYRNVPVCGCSHLTLSAVAMAMLDGILQKIAPATKHLLQEEKVDSHKGVYPVLAERLAEDSGFLLHAEVFSEQFIEAIYRKLSQR